MNPQVVILAVLFLAYAFFVRWYAGGAADDIVTLNAYAAGSTILTLFGYVILKRLSLDLKQVTQNSLAVNVADRLVVPLLTVLGVIMLNVVMTSKANVPRLDVLSITLLAFLLLVLADPGDHLGKVISDASVFQVTGGGWKKILYAHYPPRNAHDLTGYFVVVASGYLLLMLLVLRKSI